MKRLKALCLSVVLSSIISFSFLSFYSNKVHKKFDSSIVKNNSIRYSTFYSKYKSHDVLVENIDKDTILLMGSSELVASIDSKEHPKYFLDFSDKNIMQIGGGNFQSLIHAITLGSIGDDINSNTVNIILSMQWFTKEGINAEAFQSRFSIDHLNNLYRNEKLSKGLKEKIYNRILELSNGNEFNKIYIGRLIRNNMVDRVINSVYYEKYKFLKKYEFYKDYTLDNSINTKNFSNNINWLEYKNLAIERAKKKLQIITFI